MNDLSLRYELSEYLNTHETTTFDMSSVSRPQTATSIANNKAPGQV